MSEQEPQPGQDERTLAIACLCCAVAIGCGITSPLVLELEQDTEVASDAGSDEDSDDDIVILDAGDDDEAPVVVVDEPAAPMDAGRPVRRPCGTGPGCHPTDLGGESCQSLGLGHGRLLCDPVSCTFLLNLCEGLPADASTGRPCGTGAGCNPEDLGGATCESLGQPAGVLACNPDTCAFDTSLCGTGGAGTIGGLFGNFGGGAADDDGGVSLIGGFGGGGNTGGSGLFGGSFFGGGAAQ